MSTEFQTRRRPWLDPISSFLIDGNLAGEGAIRLSAVAIFKSFLPLGDVHAVQAALFQIRDYRGGNHHEIAWFLATTLRERASTTIGLA
jgi:hypothetical protein